MAERVDHELTAAGSLGIGLGPDAALALARKSIEEHGRLIDPPDGSGDGTVWGIVASGAMDMLPALVRVAAGSR